MLRKFTLYAPLFVGSVLAGLLLSSSVMAATAATESGSPASKSTGVTSSPSEAMILEAGSPGLPDLERASVRQLQRNSRDLASHHLLVQIYLRLFRESGDQSYLATAASLTNQEGQLAPGSDVAFADAFDLEVHVRDLVTTISIAALWSKTPSAKGWRFDLYSARLEVYKGGSVGDFLASIKGIAAPDADAAILIGVTAGSIVAAAADGVGRDTLNEWRSALLTIDEKKPNPYFKLTLAYICHVLGEQSLARGFYEIVLQSTPDNRVALLSHALIAGYELGDARAGERDLKRLIAVHGGTMSASELAVVHAQLGYFSLRLGRSISSALNEFSLSIAEDRATGEPESLRYAREALLRRSDRPDLLTAIVRRLADLHGSSAAMEAAYAQAALSGRDAPRPVRPSKPYRVDARRVDRRGDSVARRVFLPRSDPPFSESGDPACLQGAEARRRRSGRGGRDRARLGVFEVRRRRVGRRRARRAVERDRP